MEIRRANNTTHEDIQGGFACGGLIGYSGYGKDYRLEELSSIHPASYPPEKIWRMRQHALY